jgi:predicted RNA-binding Zn ribbon-like protein
MEKTNAPILSLGAATYAAQRAVKLITALQNNEQLDRQRLTSKVNEVLKAYGEKGKVVSAELGGLQDISSKFYAMFETDSADNAATLLNEILHNYASIPRLSAHGGTPWHLHIDSSDHAPWAEWFATSSALALAILLAEKQRNPGGLCASPACNKAFIDLGKGGGRNYCSPKCATRERVAAYRKNKK